MTAANGVANFAGLSLDLPGSYTLSAASPGLPTVITNPIGIIPGTATQLVIKDQPPANLTTGVGFALTVAAEDPYGNVDPTYTTTLKLVPGNNFYQGILSGTLSAAPVAGVATFSSVTLNQPGNGYTLRAIHSGSSGIPSVLSNSINVYDLGVATHLVITSQPSTEITAGDSFGMAISAEDDFGQIDSSFNGTITVSLSNGLGGSLLGTTTVAILNGVAAFTGLSLATTGIYTLTASRTGLPAVSTNVFSVVAGPASQLAVSTPANQIFANVPFQLQVTAEDTEGNTVPSFNGNVTITLGNNPGNGTIGGFITLDAVNGVAFFPNLTISVPGVGYTLQAAAAGLSAGASSPFNIVAEQFVATTLPPASTTAGSSFGFMVALENSSGTVDTSFNGAVTVSAANLFPSLPTNLQGVLTATATHGVAAFSGLSLATSGDFEISLSSSGLPTATLNNLVEVNASAATQLAVVTQAPQKLTEGKAFTFSVAVEDNQGNINPSYNGFVSVALKSTSSGGVLYGSSTTTAVNGIATFSGLSISTFGSGYTLQATSPGLASTASNNINVYAEGVATQLVVSTQPTAIVTAGSTFGLVVQAEDGYGDLDRTFNGSVTLAVANNTYGVPLGGTLTTTAVSGVATFSGLSLTVAGAYALSINAAGLDPATTNIVSVQAGKAIQLAGTRPTSDVRPGTVFTSKVSAVDADGNLDLSFNGSVTILLGSNPGSSTLGGSLTVNAVNGIAVFSNLTLNNLGDGYTLLATSNGLGFSTSLPFDVATTIQPITLVPSTLEGYVAGTTYVELLAAVGGTGGFTYTVPTGELPSWLSLDANTGILTGAIPTNFFSPIIFTVTATDSSGSTGGQTYSLLPNPTPTITTAFVSAPTTVFGATVVLSALVTANPPGAQIPTGVITFNDLGTYVGTAVISGSGLATFATSSLAIGSHGITATYIGLGNFTGSTSPQVNLSVTQAPTAITLTSTPSPSAYGAIISLSATVTPIMPSSGAPTGLVTFYDSSALLGTETVVNDIATFTTSSLAVGSHSLSAVYGGDHNFINSASSVVMESVVAAPGVLKYAINNGLIQRSMVTSISITFTSAVNQTLLSNAFSLKRVGLPNGEPGDNAMVGQIEVTSIVISGQTAATLTFSGANTEGGSLSDGNWTLSINPNDVINNGMPLVGSNTITGIKRLFGDFSGTGSVDSGDLGVLGTTFGISSKDPAFIAAFDSDGNGLVDSTDLGRFGTNFGLTI